MIKGGDSVTRETIEKLWQEHWADYLSRHPDADAVDYSDERNAFYDEYDLH